MLDYSKVKRIFVIPKNHLKSSSKNFFIKHFLNDSKKNELPNKRLMPKNKPFFNEKPNAFQKQDAPTISWLDKLTSSSNDLDDILYEEELSGIPNEKKSKQINKYIDEMGYDILPTFIETAWSYLMRANDYTIIKDTLDLLQKYSDECKQSESLISKIDENDKKRADSNSNMPISNRIMPYSDDNNDFFRQLIRISKYEEKYANIYLNKLISEHTNPTENRLPSLIFDFRFMKNKFSNFLNLKDAVNEFLLTISTNNRSPYPFKLKFYNYSYDTEFHKGFPCVDKFLNRNLIDVFSHSYLNDIPKNQLVYLSRDAEKEMTEYDPTKTYIIGSIVKGMSNELFASLSASKRDGIISQKIPADRYVLLKKNSRELSISSVMNLLLNLNSGLDMKTSIINGIDKEAIAGVRSSILKNYIDGSNNKKLLFFEKSILKEKLNEENFKWESNEKNKPLTEKDNKISNDFKKAISDQKDAILKYQLQLRKTFFEKAITTNQKIPKGK